MLEDLEDEKYRDLDFVELDACAGGCVGGVLQVENPYIAKAKIKRLRRYVPVSKNHLSGSIPTEMLWDTDLTYAPVLELGGTRTERFERYNQMEEILAELPGLDCVSIGPNLLDIHTPRERMEIASVQRVWRFVLEVLKRSK